MLKDIIALLEEASGLPKDALAPFVKGDGSIDEEVAPGLLKQAREGIATKLKEAGEVAKEKTKEIFDNGYKKAQGETLGKYEEELARDLGIDGKMRGKELRDAIKAAKAGTSNGTPDKDAVERHPHYLETVEKAKSEREAAVKTVQDEFEAFKKKVQGDERNGKVWDSALPMIDELRPAYSETESVKAFQMRAIREGLFAEYDYDIQDGGKRIVVLTKDGKVAKDELGNPIEFKALVGKVVGTRVGTLKAEKRDTSAVPPGEKGGDKDKGNAWKKPVPKNADELSEILTSRDYTTEEKKGAKAAFEAASKTA